MKFYANPHQPEHAANNAAFARILTDYPQISLFQPSPEKAPWHCQAIIDMGGYAQLINFWPHLLKGQRENYKSVQGEHGLRAIIEQAIEDAQEEPFDVIER